MAVAWGLFALLAHADGRLLATGGVTEIEGSAGGGIVPWAVIAGYGTRDETGATAFFTYLPIDDFRLRSMGAALGVHDRVEFSFARQQLDLGSTVPGQSIRLDIFGAKLKVAGDAIYDQDRWLPQISIGAQYKVNRDFDLVPRALGAKHASGTDAYVSATKLYLAGLLGRNVLLDGTLRATKANQLGLLGFGGDRSDRYQMRFEGSAAVFLNDQVAAGVEYRGKPNNLGVFTEDSFEDLFVAYVPNKHVALVAGYAWLGNIADKPRQRSLYLSMQANF